MGGGPESHLNHSGHITNAASAVPLLVGKRFSIEFITDYTPLRHHLIHQRDETIRVIALKEMGKFMDNHVFEALKRFLCQFEIQPYSPRFDIAASPFCSHPFDAPSWRRNTIGFRPTFH